MTAMAGKEDKENEFISGCPHWTRSQICVDDLLYFLL